MRKIILLSFVSTAAFAGGNHHVPTPNQPDPQSSAAASAVGVAKVDVEVKTGKVENNVAGGSGGVASSQSVSNSAGGSGGAGGSSTSSAQSISGDSSANGGVSSASPNMNQVRQVPSIGQGSIIPPACGAGGNAGGANSHGAGFLGFSWVTGDCHKYLLAQNYLALGMYDAACVVLNTTKTAKRAFEEYDLPLPACVFVEAKKEGPPMDPARYVTKDELKERDDRMARKFGGK